VLTFLALDAPAARLLDKPQVLRLRLRMTFFPGDGDCLNFSIA
jgi:hypothetical protein